MPARARWLQDDQYRTLNTHTTNGRGFVFIFIFIFIFGFVICTGANTVSARQCRLHIAIGWRCRRQGQAWFTIW